MMILVKKANTRKIIAAICALSLLALAFAACGGKAEQRIAGRWEPDGPAQFQNIEFIPNGDKPQRGQVNLSMMGNEISGKYEIAPGDKQHRLTITYTLALLPTTREFLFTIKGDTLVLQEDKASASTTYRRIVAE